MAKIVRFKQLQLLNFTNHRSLTVDFGPVTKLTGQNGEGKTSIGTVPTWVLFGSSIDGKAFNPSPTTYEFDRVFASMLIEFDGSEVLLAREIDEKGANKFYINEVPTKAKEYEAYIAELFNKEEFLSFYNPGYFFTQHWTKQREQVMKHVVPPSNKEVFQEMSRITPDQKPAEIVHSPQAARLADELKKLSISDLTKKHTDLKNKNEKAHIQSQGSVKTLTDQLAALGPAVAIDREALQVEGEELDKKIQNFDEDRKLALSREYERRTLQSKIDSLVNQRESVKTEHTTAKAKQIETNCHACGQELTDEAKETAAETRKSGVNALVVRYNALNDEIKQLREKLEALPSLPEPEYTVGDLVARIGEINSILHSDASRVKAAADLEKAKQAEADYLKAKNDSIFVLDAIKEFVAKEAEMQVEKVQALFTRLTVRLHKYVASRDEYDPDFSIQMDGKDYACLSVGEKIAAGLELTEVLFKQSDLIVPTFIDGIESYTGPVAVYDQLITGRAVPDQNLKIESEEV